MSERVVCGPRRAELAKTFRRRRGKSSQLRPEGGGGAPSQNQNPVFLTLSHVCHVSSPPSLLQVYQSARVDGLLIFSIIPTKLKTAPVSAPGVSVARLLFAPYSTFLVPPPVYAKEGYGGGISMDGFTST